LKFKNFLSFKDEVVFSFEATSDKYLEDYYVAEPEPGVRILKMAMIYGANASGKSNVLHAFDFVRSFVKRIPSQSEKSTEFIPFKFVDNQDLPGSFDMIFYIEGTKYKYSLVLDEEKVHSEILHYYPGTQPAIIFERTLDIKNDTSILKFGSKIKLSDQAIEAIQLKTLKNMSVFAAFTQVNISLPQLNIPLNWFRKQFMPMIDPYSSLTNYSDSYIKKDERVKNQALDFINKADFNISAVSFKKQTTWLDDEVLKLIEAGSMPDEQKHKLLNEKAIHIDKRLFEHKIIINNKAKYYSLPDELESKGTLRYYGLSAPFFNAISNDSFLSIDEIGTALHPLLVMHFLKEFLKKSNKAQLLFSTHNDSLLSEKDIIRKDAIWFTEKDKQGITSLYSLSDFNIRKELSYYNAYKQGKFGAIPNLNE
ncbi:AAA family ATPase, partial [Candidatus Gracilibacteria bacterium]|nr:AAA family ATPase [Candidatus Gracilibacteria bacterium]